MYILNDPCHCLQIYAQGDWVLYMTRHMAVKFSLWRPCARWGVTAAGWDAGRHVDFSRLGFGCWGMSGGLCVGAVVFWKCDLSHVSPGAPMTIGCRSRRSRGCSSVSLCRPMGSHCIVTCFFLLCFFDLFLFQRNTRREKFDMFVSTLALHRMCFFLF